MINDKKNQQLLENWKEKGVDAIPSESYIWYEDNWAHDKYEHSHQRYQLTYVEDGYQYFHINKQIFLVPQNHVIWIPSNLSHRTTSQAKTVNLMIILFKTTPDQTFYKDIHVFPAPAVLKEMLLYAAKWNQQLFDEEEHTVFLRAILQSLPYFCEENQFLKIPVPIDQRLTPVCNYINVNYRYTSDTDTLAHLANMSVRSLQRIFKQQTGITIQKYTQLIRILKSIELIDTGQYTLTQIATMIGYKSLSAFTSSYQSIMLSRPNVKK